VSQFPSILALSCSTCIILHAWSVVPVALELCMYMHVLKACMCICTYPKLLGMFLHVSDIIKSWACIYICWLISRDKCVLAFVGNWECICIRWLVSRARSMYRESSGYLHVPASTKNWPLCLHLPALIEGWACPCMCVHVRSLLSDSSRQYQVLLCNHQLIKLRLAITHATL
jgi:hypothetical protein